MDPRRHRETGNDLVSYRLGDLNSPPAGWMSATWGQPQSTDMEELVERELASEPCASVVGEAEVHSPYARVITSWVICHQLV